MLYRVNEAETIDPTSQMHYRFHQKVNASIYPQVHDFYELTLMTFGQMNIELEIQQISLLTGTLVLLRPGDIHTRSCSGRCNYINLAFPNRIMMDLFRYLDDQESLQRIVRAVQPPVVQLSSEECERLRTCLENLNLLPVGDSHRVSMELRRLVLELVMKYILPVLPGMDKKNIPLWLQKLVEQAGDPEIFAKDLDKLADLSGRTKEHVCRSFRKYLGCSPTEYLNRKRLNYGANLLLHTDKKIIDVAYDSGFRSLSRFYHAFQKEFQCSPAKYRSLGKC